MQIHCKKKYILNIDLMDFFTQIHFGRVRGLFLSAPYKLSDEVATTLSQIACYNGCLPQGAPSSPILTNMICKSLDNQLMRLAKTNRISYSRYADDITLSSNSKFFPSSIVKNSLSCINIGDELEQILTNNSFKVNCEKIYLNNSFTRQEVTGLVVNQFPNIKHEYIKNIRAILNNCKKRGILDTATTYINKGFCNCKYILSMQNENKDDEIVKWFKRVLKGKISYIKQIKGKDSFTYLKLASVMNNVFNEYIFDVSSLDKLNSLIENSVFVIESTTNKKSSQGSAFILDGYGLLTSYHVANTSDFYKIYKISNNKNEEICTIHESTRIKFNEKIDYILYRWKSDNVSFELGDSRNLKQGMKITIIGYPNYMKGNTAYIQSCEITSKTNSFEEILYTVSGRVVHGASGGCVLNSNKEVIGLLKSGIVSSNDDAENEKQGFIPIHLILDDITKK